LAANEKRFTNQRAKPQQWLIANVMRSFHMFIYNCFIFEKFKYVLFAVLVLENGVEV